MRMRGISILPSLCTLGNALSGFAAITFMWKALVAMTPSPGAVVTEDVGPLAPHDVLIAGYFILLGMVFDALDGRLARFARATSDFGGQLDSLADAITFGVAPAFLMNRVVVESLRGHLPDELLRFTWVCAAVYMGCALIRLARFNVENVHDEEAHRSFKGLPSPAAAGALTSLVIVLAWWWERDTMPGTRTVMLWLMPLAAVVLGVLMVSNVRYIHLLNRFVRGRRPISHLVAVLLVVGLALLLQHVVLVLGFIGYTLSGPIAYLARRGHPPGEPPEPDIYPAGDEPAEEEDEGPAPA